MAPCVQSAKHWPRIGVFKRPETNNVAERVLEGQTVFGRIELLETITLTANMVISAYR